MTGTTELEERTEQWLKKPARCRFFPDTREFPETLVTFPPDGCEYDLPEIPSYLSLEVTNACNLKCKHCYYKEHKSEIGYVSEETFEKTIAECKQYNITLMTNLGGESLLHKDYLSYLKYAQDEGVATYFNTNATLLSSEYSRKLLSFYKGGISFSVDGDENYFKKFRQGGEYGAVIENIEGFLEKNRTTGSPISINVHCCNLGQNTRERIEFLNNWVKIADSVSFGEVFDGNNRLISEPMIDLRVKRKPLCIVPWQSFGIKWNGDVIPCPCSNYELPPWDRIKLGNINKMTIKEIWKSEAYIEFRKAVAEGQLDICRGCDRFRSQFSFKEENRHNLIVRRNGLSISLHKKI